MMRIRKPGDNPFRTLDDPEGLNAPPEYWALKEAERAAAVPHSGAPPADIAELEAQARAAFGVPSDHERLAAIAANTEAMPWAHAETMQVAPPPRNRSELVISDVLVFTLPAPRPNLWRRFWTWALLGWCWRKL